MKRVWVSLAALLIAAVTAACDVLASDWPSRQHRAPDQILADVVRLQQRRAVKESTGEWAYQCFTDDDFAEFRSADVPRQIARRLRQSRDFAIVVAALRALPPQQLADALEGARKIARPTWRTMGFIDRQGRGQTEAGHAAERMIADAIVDEFSSALSDKRGNAAPRGGSPNRILTAGEAQSFPTSGN